MKNEEEIENLYSNPFDEERFMNYDNKDFDEEVNALIEWCEDLDYDKYVANWTELATSGKATLPTEEYSEIEENFTQ